MKVPILTPVVELVEVESVIEISAKKRDYKPKYKNI